MRVAYRYQIDPAFRATQIREIGDPYQVDRALIPLALTVILIVTSGSVRGGGALERAGRDRFQTLPFQ